MNVLVINCGSRCMSKTFLDELYITALMAAPSLGRRSWYHSPSDIKKAAALIFQSRRWVYGRVKRAAVRRLFFFCRRLADGIFI